MSTMTVSTMTDGQVSTRTVDVPQDVVNRDTIQAKVLQALTTNATFLAAAKPGTASAQASAAYDQVSRLTRQVNALIRLLVVDDTSTITDS